MLQHFAPWFLAVMVAKKAQQFGYLRMINVYMPLINKLKISLLKKQVRANVSVMAWMGQVLIRSSAMTLISIKLFGQEMTNVVVRTTLPVN